MKILKPQKVPKKNLYILIRQPRSLMKKKCHLCILNSFLSRIMLVMIVLQNKIWFTTIKTT